MRPAIEPDGYPGEAPKLPAAAIAAVDEQTAAGAETYIASEFARLLLSANDYGFNVTIERVSVPPLAMGNTINKISVWEKR